MARRAGEPGQEKADFQDPAVPTLHEIDAGVLCIAFLEAGPADGWPVVLVHGFPYDALCYREVAGILAREGARVIMPWMRGYGATRFLDPETMRSGQQGAFGADLRALLDALQIDRAILGGFDWGGRAACVVAALWPERVEALVSAMGYNITDPSRAAEPAAPVDEHRFWYIWYLHSLRGSAGLASNREQFCRLLWRQWSPCWNPSEQIFEDTAKAFANPDFVDVVVHSYRHRFGLVEGDASYGDFEHRLAALPPIEVPAVIVDGAADGLVPPAQFRDFERYFKSGFEYHLLPDTGHNPPQENPDAFAKAVVAARRLAASEHAETAKEKT